MRCKTTDLLTSPHCCHGRATADTSGLRVRTAPLTGAILGSLVYNQIVDVWAVERDWALVQAENGLTGWCSLEYLTIIGELTP